MMWRHHFTEGLTCVRCLQTREAGEVDRLLWCDECKAAARRRAALWGWVVGGGVAALLAAWIWLVIEPSDLIIGGWVATVVAAFYLTGRIGREIIYGAMRIRNREAVEATPPAEASGDDEATGRA